MFTYPGNEIRGMRLCTKNEKIHNFRQSVFSEGAANRYKFDSTRKNESPGPATKNDFALEGCHLINYAEGNETTIYC